MILGWKIIPHGIKKFSQKSKCMEISCRTPSSKVLKYNWPLRNKQTKSTRSIWDTLYLTFFIFTIWSNNGKTVLSFFNQLGVNLSKVYIHLTLWWRKGTSCTLLLWLNRPEIDKIYTYIGIIKYLKGKKEHSEKFAIQGEVTINNVLPGWHCMNSEYYCFI